MQFNKKEEFPFSVGLRRIKWQDENGVCLWYLLKVGGIGDKIC
jgi:hypothetical protein